MRCIGRTKLQLRCSNRQKFILCNKHLWQPIIFLIPAILFVSELFYYNTGKHLWTDFLQPHFNNEESTNHTEAEKNKGNLFNNYLNPAYEKFEKAHINYLESFKIYREIISKYGFLTKEENLMLKDKIKWDSRYQYDSRFMVLLELESLKEYKEYDFNPLIHLVNDYFEGPINGESIMVKEINELDGQSNAPRATFYRILDVLFDSYPNEETKIFISVQGIDEIIICLQKKKESIHKEFLKAKMALLGI